MKKNPCLLDDVVVVVQEKKTSFLCFELATVVVVVANTVSFKDYDENKK
jgi:hypothetical protein